jgi:peptide/nickel transport system substrate-binding protein
MLPPNFPGYRPYCPWTIAPDVGGQWSGPDLDEAQRLIDRSGTRGAQVVVGPLLVRFNAEVGPYVVSVLEELGYDVSLETAESNEEVLEATFVDMRVQVGIFSFAGASTAYFLANTCDANIGLSNYCDPGLDARIAAARSLDVTDPAAAAEAWAAIDRELTDLAIHAPLVTEGTSFVSARVRNFQHHAQWGMLLDQAWAE